MCWGLCLSRLVTWEGLLCILAAVYLSLPSPGWDHRQWREIPTTNTIYHLSKSLAERNDPQLWWNGPKSPNLLQNNEWINDVTAPWIQESIPALWVKYITYLSDKESDLFTLKVVGALSKEWVLYTWLLWSQENSLLVVCCLASIWEVLGMDNSAGYTYPKLLTLVHRTPTGRISLLGEEMFFRKNLFIATFPNSMQALGHLLQYLSHVCFSALVWLDLNEDWWCLHDPHQWLLYCST